MDEKLNSFQASYSWNVSIAISLALVLNLLRVEFAKGLLQSVDLILALLDTVSIGHASVDACRLEIFQFLQDIVKHALVLVEIVHVLYDLGIRRLQIRLGLTFAGLFGGN